LARHRKRFPPDILPKVHGRDKNLQRLVSHTQEDEFQLAISNLNDSNPEIQLRAIKELADYPTGAVSSFPSLFRLLPTVQGELRLAVETSMRLLMPAWLRWNLYEAKSPSTVVAAIEQIKSFCPLPSDVMSLLQRISNDLSAIDSVRFLAKSLLDSCDGGDRLASFQKEQAELQFAKHIAQHILGATSPKPNTESRPRLSRPRRAVEVRSVYPRVIPVAHADSLGIRIEEFSQDELRFYARKKGDLLLLWNRGTNEARFALYVSAVSEVRDLNEAIRRAYQRLSKLRIRIGSIVDLLNVADKSVETYRITDAHHDLPCDCTLLKFNSPLGSQLIGLCEGEDVVVKVPKGEINYRVERVLSKD